MSQPTPVVLYLAPGARRSPFHDAFVEALEQRRPRRGPGIDLHWVFAAGEEEPARLRDLVAGAIREHRPNVIVTASTPLTDAARASAPDTPIVMTISGSPVQTGLVASVRRPGANVTGSTSKSHQLSRKQLEALREHVRQLDQVAIIWNPRNPAKQLEFEAAVRATRALRIRLTNRTAPPELIRRLEVTGDDADFADAFRAARDGGARAVIVMGDPLTVRNREAIAAAGRGGPPAIYESSDFVEAGGLMSYGPDRRQLYRNAAHLVARVLRGESPARIAVPTTRFALTVNDRLAAEMRRKGLM